MTTQAEALAAAFVADLRVCLTGDQWDEIRARNALSTYQGCCASHDFVDANMNMAAAFEKVTGREPQTDSDGDAALWNEAWAIARRGALAEQAPV